MAFIEAVTDQYELVVVLLSLYKPFVRDDILPISEVGPFRRKLEPTFGTQLG